MGLAESLNRIDDKLDSVIDRVTVIETQLKERQQFYKSTIKLICAAGVIFGIFFSFDKYKIRIEKPEQKAPVKTEQNKDT